MELNLKGDRPSVHVTMGVPNTQTQSYNFPPFVTGKLKCWLAAGGLGLEEEKEHSDILLAQDGKASDLSHSDSRPSTVRPKVSL